jgi:hypothetical protein
MKLVIIESPYAGQITENVAYARKCVRDCLHRGEAPIASHLLFTQEGILDDGIEAERKLGIAAGLAWVSKAETVVVYVDRGISSGVKGGIQAAKDAGVPIEFRSLDGLTQPEELERIKTAHG